MDLVAQTLKTEVQAAVMKIPMAMVSLIQVMLVQTSHPIPKMTQIMMVAQTMMAVATVMVLAMAEAMVAMLMQTATGSLTMTTVVLIHRWENL